MKCKLCGLDKNLIKAHIIPDFMYHELFNQNHRFRQISLENKVYQKSIPRETGEFDKTILCEKCDTGILGSNYEDYAKRVLYSGGAILPTETERLYNKHWAPIGNIDYKKFKLFLLSILWRASITSRPFFNQVKLDHHEKIIKEMIFNDDPKNKEDYPTLIIYAGHYTTQIISRPKLVGKKGDKIYTFLIAGVYYIFFIECDVPDYLYETTINEKNELKVLLVDKASAAEFINLNLFK